MSTTLTPVQAPDAPGAPTGATAPRRPAARIALVYAALVFPLLFLDGLRATPLWIVVAHLAAVAGLAWAARTPRPHALADWLPISLTPFFYVELPALIAGVNAPFYHDGTVQRWELAIFGFQPSHELAGMLPWVALSEAGHAGYLAYYLMIFGPPAVLYLRDRREAFAASQLAILATFITCYICFIAFPVQGPRYSWPSPPGIPDGPLLRLARTLLEGGSSRGTAFPSSHAAVAVASVMGALRYQPRIGIATAITTVFLVFGAVYGGYHYAIDMLVGVGVGLIVSTLALRWFERGRTA